MRVFAICSILLVLFGISLDCRSGNPTSPELIDQSNLRLSDLSEEDQVREAIFRSAGFLQISKSNRAESYYLAVDDDKDPTDSLMKYLNRDGSSIKKVSGSYISKTDVGRVFDKFTDKKGARLLISKLNWLGVDKVKASAGMYRGNMESDSCTYTLVRDNGEWKFVSKLECVVA